MDKNKLELELKLLDRHISFYQHGDSMLWNRFTVFIAIFTLVISFLGVDFGLIISNYAPDSNKMILKVIFSLVSFLMLIIGIIFHSIIERMYKYNLYHVMRGKELQEIILKTQDNQTTSSSIKDIIKNFDAFIPESEDIFQMRELKENKISNFLASIRSITLLRFIFYAGDCIMLSLIIIGFFI